MKKSIIVSRTLRLLFVALLLALFVLVSPPSFVTGVTFTSPAGVSVLVTSGGAYSIRALSPAWTFGGNIGKSLANMTVHAGKDHIGSYQEITFTYQASTARSGAIRVYDSKPVVLFTDTYLSAGSNSNPFPRLTQYPLHLQHLTYSGTFAHYSFRTMGYDSPWLFFDTRGNSFMLSPAANFMLASTQREPDGSITSGISAAIPLLPQGFTQRTFLVIGSGINATFETWGHAMTDLQGKDRPANDANIPLDFLGYWTDAGATYYYSFDPTKGYTGTLLAVRDAFHRLGIPLGYMELDSWWYPKGLSASWQGDTLGDKGGIYTYTADPTLFPQGLKGFHQKLSLPLGTHARWIDPLSPYRAEYSMSRNIITDVRYWNAIAANLENEGVIIYEQDWLNHNALPATNLNDPQAFLNNMASAMATYGISIQYCMALPRHFLQSTEYNNVTTIRVSNDHFTRARWDEFLYASRLAGSLGVWPSSDVFMSTEKYNLLLATLSAGIVGVGDPIGKINKRNLLHSVRADGVIVKPDTPVVPVDDLYIQDAKGLHSPMVAATYTDHSGMKAYYVFAYRRGKQTTVTLKPTSLGLVGKAYVYNFFTGRGKVVAAGSAYSNRVTNASYYIVAPIGPSGIAFLGDKGKFVSLGKKRITQLRDDGNIEATIAFARGETTLKMHGYAPSMPVIAAAQGTVRSLVYHSSTHLFSFIVSPGNDSSSAVITISPDLSGT